MNPHLIWIIAALGGASIFGVFVTKKPGFGPFNLRALGIVLVATFASLLAVCNKESVSAAMGILGAIAGYLFGIRWDDSEKPPATAQSPQRATSTSATVRPPTTD